MCGARGESTSKLMRALPQLRFYGFEADPEEVERLRAAARPGFTYFPAAVAGQNGRRTLYVTGHPACSSLIAPNEELLRPYLAAPRMQLAKEVPIDVVALDEYLPGSGVSRIDFLDLDTQGSELEILQGAKKLLSAGTAVVKTEVEFVPFYRDQPLFGDVDRFLRAEGFWLFDLRRSRYRRAAFPATSLTRGQLLCGDAWYLRDYRTLAAAGHKQSLFTLCLLAAQLQFHDYAMEILDFLQGDDVSVSREEKAALADTHTQYLRDLDRSAWWTGVITCAETMGLRGPLKALGRLSTQLGDRLKKDRDMMEMNWED
jgi:FkbM family methyltransferase